MPFLKLNNDWSKLAQYYNQSFNNKPEVPTLKYTAFDDGLIRGGVLNATLASARDTARVGKFLASGKGALFIIKQVGLQLSNPRLEQEEPKDTFGKLGTKSTKSDLLNKAAGIINTATTAINGFIKERTPNQIYNLGLNTLTQIPLMAFGGHIIRQGLLPIGGGGYLNGSTDNIKGYNYEKITKANNIASKQSINQVTSTNNQTPTTGVTGAASGGSYTNIIKAKNQASADKIQADLIAEGKIPDITREQTLSNITIKAGRTPLSYQEAPNRLLQYLKIINTDTSKDIPTLSNFVSGPSTLQDYKGGAQSIFGIGNTTIKTYPDQRTNISNISDDPKAELLNGFTPKPYKELDRLSTKLSSNRLNQTYINTVDSPTTDDSLNIEDRIGVSKIGKSSKLRSVDSINTISVMSGKTFYEFAASGSTPNGINSNSSLFTYTPNTNGKSNGGIFGRDIIKFRIEFINNNLSNGDTEMLVFRAYIDDFNDGMSAKWNSYRYMGRGEDFYVYDGFTRDISISFTIYAHSPEEMKPLYQKLNYLMSTFTPDYNTQLKMRGNIAKLTVGDYLYQQPGIFTDIKLSGMLDTHWEIGIEGKDQYEVPKHIKVNLSFKPIHNFLPRRVIKDTMVSAPFITRNDKNNKYLSPNTNKVAPMTQEEFDKLALALNNNPVFNLWG